MKKEIFFYQKFKKNEYLFYKKGLEFLKLYPLLKEFKNYINNYPLIISTKKHYSSGFL